MEDLTFLYISFFLTLGSFRVGFLISWNIKAAFDEWQSKADYAKIVMHPEMYDENGNPVADSLIAFRFDGDQTLPDDED